jgi:hypothetical protein
MRIACALLVAAFAAGCGGGGTEQDPKDPKAALKQMFTEFSEGNAKGDWEQVCSRVTREFVYQRYVTLKEAGQANPPRDCVKQMQGAWSQPRSRKCSRTSSRTRASTARM